MLMDREFPKIQDDHLLLLHLQTHHSPIFFASAATATGRNLLPHLNENWKLPICRGWSAAFSVRDVLWLLHHPLYQPFPFPVFGLC